MSDKTIDDKIMEMVLEKLVAIDGRLQQLEAVEKKPSVFRKLLGRLWGLMLPCIVPAVCLVFVFMLGLWAGNNNSPPPTTTLEQLIMSEPEARRTASAMSVVETDILNNRIQDTQTASEALRTELPTNVRDPVVETVEKHSDGTIEQYPEAMRETRRRIFIRR